MNYGFFPKIKNQFLLLLSIFLFSCNFNPFQTNDDNIWDGKVYTIPELQNSEDLCDGETYLLEGFIEELNCHPEDNRFLLFAEKNGYFGQVLIGNVIEVKVVENSNTIFNKIREEFDKTNEEWLHVIIKGKAKTWIMVGNGWSEETFLMEIGSIKISN